MDTALVSIILFAHAPYAKFIPESLGSILAQSYSSLEVIVLGDGSKELEQALDPFRIDSRCIPCIQGDQPFLQAANERMKEARGKYIGTWNSDDIYNRDHVKLLVQALEDDAVIGAAFDNTEYFSDTPNANGDSSLGLILRQDRAKKLSSARLSVQNIVEENFMTGPSSLIRKSVFEQVGGYDKDIYLNCDLHWFYRIAAYFPVSFVDYIGVRKRVHPLNNTAVNPHYEYGVRELVHIRERYPDVYSRIGKRVFNKKLGRKYFRLGLYYENRGELEKARDSYRQAMLLRKWTLRYSWEYLRSRILAS
ncbi:MAG: glycosyltransferase [Deltaproteobacteria bacterium]|nr:glycosyltransferase [Deltaproteobacteria bacterium]